MSDFGWFALIIIAIISVIGAAIYLTNSTLPLLALLLMPNFKPDGD